jgi:GNAT superfamily N-acetyltransferase
VTQPGARPGQPVLADQADADVLSRVIAEAFHPLPPSQWLIPDPNARRGLYPGYFRIFVELALAGGIVHTTQDRTAAALWLPAGEGEAAEPPAGYPVRLAAATGPWLDRFAAFDEVLERGHPAGPAHQHLAMLAVRPDRQGRGTGTALLRAHLAELDQAGTPTYLEASAPRNRALYLRHGYRDHGPPIRLPDGTAMFPMWREPFGGLTPPPL